jgi:hypothetical protein
MRIECALALGLIMTGVASLPAQGPMPNANPPAPNSACAATAAASKWECPTCGHQGACPTCGHSDEFTCLRRLGQWLFYRPGTRGDQSCPRCCEPCHPPLYAWFPCAAGCDGCTSCRAGSGGSCSQGRSIGDGRVAKLAKCGPGRGRCSTGECGEFRFAHLGREKFLYSNGAAESCHSGPDAGPQAAAPTAPTPAATPATDGAPQPTTSYKKDPETSTPTTTAPTLPTSNRMTTYRPDAIAPTMPVLSPDQFRTPKR